MCAAGDKRSVCADVQTAQLAEVLGHVVLVDEGRRVAVPSGALCLGDGARPFSMVVERIVDLVDHHEIAGRIGDVLVHVPLPPALGLPSTGDRLLVHANRWSVLAS